MHDSATTLTVGLFFFLFFPFFSSFFCLLEFLNDVRDQLSTAAPKTFAPIDFFRVASSETGHFQLSKSMLAPFSSTWLSALHYRMGGLAAALSDALVHMQFTDYFLCLAHAVVGGVISREDTTGLWVGQCAVYSKFSSLDSPNCKGLRCKQHIEWAQRVMIRSLDQVVPVSPTILNSPPARKAIFDPREWSNATLDSVFNMSFQFMVLAGADIRAAAVVVDPSWQTGIVISSILLVITAGIVTCGIVLRAWTAQRVFLVGTLGVGLSAMLALSVLRVLGYTTMFERAGMIPRMAVDLMDRTAQVFFLVIFALFTWMVGEATLEEFSERAAALRPFFGIFIAAVTLIVSIYSIIVAVLMLVPISHYVLDVSVVLLPATSLLFAGMLTGLFALLLGMVVSKKRNHPQFGEMRRNSVIFGTVSLILAAMFLGLLVIGIVSFDSDPVLSLMTGDRVEPVRLVWMQFGGNCVLSLAVLAYLAVPLVVKVVESRKLVRDSSRSTDGEGYVPLLTSEEGMAVPRQYADF